MLVKELISELNRIAPFALQEDYDNAGLLVGSMEAEAVKGLIAVDVTSAVLNEAVQKDCNVVLSHHPLIFGGLKNLTDSTDIGKMVAFAVKNDINIIALHTNLDNVAHGVNDILGQKLGLKNCRILQPLKNQLRKLVTFCPEDYTEKVSEALFSAGAGHIGKYDSCSFTGSGNGTFRAGEGANPFVGEVGKLHHESENRIETVFPAYLEKDIISALINAHPYEEVAYDIYPLSNSNPTVGAGMIGELEKETDTLVFLESVKKALCLPWIKYSGNKSKKVRKVAFCGGSGSFLIKQAISAGADVFLTGDLKYHDFFLPGGNMLLADIGHYESEQFTKELIFTLLNEKFATFALLQSEVVTNPINYL
jgi:dinuclear metal center YbgI/SA1388 family protein